MYNLYPYFTNDGTVGLFSKEDDDIYHSTYGALSESWQKFILPSNLEKYLFTHKEVKILDLCYGIGYNTKVALQVLVNLTLEKNKNSKKISGNFLNYAAIDNDNVLTCELNKIQKSFYKFLNKKRKISIANSSSNSAIYTDNIPQEVSKENGKKNFNIFIDAVDLDKNLIHLSPFISDGIKNSLSLKKYLHQKYFQETNLPQKIVQIQRIRQTGIKPVPKKYRLTKETQIILLIKLLENNPTLLNDEILNSILVNKNFTPFLNDHILNFSEFCQKLGYKYNLKGRNLSFLHNIYYQYISKSYKKALEIIQNNKISINFHSKDARRFIKISNTKYHFIFLDAFTPSKSPALWTLEFIKELNLKLEDDGMILTYSNSAAVRNAFLQNNFYVGKIYDPISKKYTGTIATKNKNLIKNHLDENDLNLINSKAGICFKDKNLNLDNKSIIQNREIELNNTDLMSSSQVLKRSKNAKPL